VYKIVRKISILIFIIWFSICAVYVYPNKKAEAVIPLALVPYAATVLVAAGVTFATNAELQNTTKAWLGTLPTIRTDLMLQDYNAAVNGTKAVCNVATDVWNDAKTWVDNLINPGANDVNLSITDTAGVTIEYALHPDARNELLVMTSSRPYLTHFYVLKSDGKYEEYGIKTLTLHNIIASGGKVKIETGTNTSMEFATRNRTYTETASLTANSTTNIWDCADGAVINVLTMKTNASLTGATDWVDNPTRDWSDGQGLRKVGVPLGGVIDELLGKSHPDVKQIDTGTSDPPADAVFDGTTEITGLSSVFDAIKIMSANIAKFFDLTIPVNMDPLKLSGEIFTTRFPFSLPWDLMRSFQLFNDNTFNPVLNVDIPAGPILPNLNFNIDLSVWSSIVGYVKALELLIFDITLVLVTRKLLGGGV